MPAHLQALFRKLPNPGSDEVVALFPADAGGGLSGAEPQAYQPNGKNAVYGTGMGGGYHAGFSDSGSAARFFYCAKASAEDRTEGAAANGHPTVKPVDLMRYLCRLITPPGGTVLDPFMGSGSTGKAAKLEDLRFIGIEREAEYVEIARARIRYVQTQTKLFA